MKNFQQHLLIFLAICLCGLCTYQWYFETVQRERLDHLNLVVYEKSTDIQGYTNSMRAMDRQIAQMDQQITLLRETAKTNEQVMLAQKRQIARLESSNEILSKEITQYSNAVNGVQASLKTAYDGIAKQNKAVEELVTQRDEFIHEYNDSVKERNDLVTKYNQLVERLAALQSNNAKVP